MKYGIKEIGLYQWGIIIIAALACCPGNWGNSGIIIMTWKVDHWCQDNAPSFQNLSTSQQRQIMASSSNRCRRPNVNFSQYTSDEILTMNFSTMNWTKCDQGFSYSHEYMDYTATEQFDLVCEREWLINFINTIYMLGFFIAAIGSGVMADKYGRKFVLVFFDVLSGVAHVLAAYSPNIELFIFARFWTAVGDIATYTGIFILQIELMRKDKRLLPGLVTTISYAVALVVYSAIAMVLRNHQHLQLMIAAMYFGVAVVHWLLVPESVRWLVSQNRHEEADKIVLSMSRFNKQNVRDLDYLYCGVENVEKRGGLCDLVRTPNLRKRTLVMCVQWCSLVMVWYALLFGLGDFNPDVRKSLMITSALDVPGLVLNMVTVDRFGRQISSFACSIAASICCLAIVPLAGGTSIWTLVLAVVGKLFAGMQFFVIYMHTPELYPTVTRTMGLGLCSTVSRIAGMLAPQIALLNQFWPATMVFTLGVVGMVSALLTPFLPDTTGHELPQTVDDGERFMAEHTYKLVLPKKRRLTKATVKEETNENNINDDIQTEMVSLREGHTEPDL